jgi:hypothetical protein
VAQGRLQKVLLVQRVVVQYFQSLPHLAAVVVVQSNQLQAKAVLLVVLVAVVALMVQLELHLVLAVLEY